jgi:hypothetical protein
MHEPIKGKEQGTDREKVHQRFTQESRLPRFSSLLVVVSVAAAEVISDKPTLAFAEEVFP